ncbi:MAG TPA: hypothetical protein VN132_08720, partial [Bdellovibrio sp.]|nr:hypothetical protein [Bdellovibrio sp.]
ALDLIQNDLLPAPMYSAIENAVYKSLQNDDGYDTFGLMVFPWWQDCRDFVWRWNVTQPSEKFLRIKKAITSRCDLVDTAKN